MWLNIVTIPVKGSNAGQLTRELMENERIALELTKLVAAQSEAPEGLDAGVIASSLVTIYKDILAELDEEEDEGEDEEGDDDDEEDGDEDDEDDE